MNIPNGGFPPIICMENKNIKKDIIKLKKNRGIINLVNLLKKPDKNIIINDNKNDILLNEIKEL